MNASGSAPARRARLSHTVTEQLQRLIVSGALPAGAQLPTEQQLVIQFGVSRTVVREAVSVLRANGLVEARQGAGVFVVGEKAAPSPTVFSDNFASLASTLELFEVRAPLEIEAAGIAAMRRTVAQELEMRSALQRLAGSPFTIEADVELHVAIATATGNRFYTESLAFLARKTISRPTASIARCGSDLEAIGEEHALIVEAIGDQDPEAARDAMRKHLLNSARRFRAAAMKNSGR